MSPPPGAGRSTARPREPCSTASSRCCGGSPTLRHVHEAPEQGLLALDEGARLAGVEVPAPRARGIEDGAHFGGAASRHRVEPARVAAMALRALADIEHDAGRGALELIGELGATAPQLSSDGTQRADEIE